MRTCNIGLLLAVLLFQPAAKASLFTGNQLISFCSMANITAMESQKNTEESIGGTICTNYVAGVVDGFRQGVGGGYAIRGNEEITADPKHADTIRAQLLNTLNSKSPLANRLVCLPEDASYTQLARIVAKYLSDNPAELNKSGALLVLNAIIAAYPPPCDVH